MELSSDLKEKLTCAGEGLVQIAEGIENHFGEYYRGTLAAEDFGAACQHLRNLAQIFDRWATGESFQPPEFQTCINWAGTLDHLSVKVEKAFIRRESEYSTGDPEALNKAAAALRALAVAKAE